MKIEAFLICWNEIEILPLVIKHYKKFCNKITIYDNYSTDGSDKLAESLGCEVIKFGIEGKLDDLEYLKVKNHCWKGSKADYVIVCDCDEVLIPEPIELDRFPPTLITTIGWNIYSEQMPKNDLLEITEGYEFSNYSKNIMFNPAAIEEINYHPGSHRCDPIGIVVYSKYPLYLLHYKNIGGVERQLKRNQEYRKRLSYNNKKMGYGIHYLDSEATIRREWKERLAKSKPLL